jgi:7,8-dihydropterin-6-yl-methyl-4-(beta-D-ribofuranosyl)aminobenzene 5'-phosphate synthase
MKIALLCENSVGLEHYEVCLAEWGLSALIEVNGTKVLFDTGTSYVYQHNAKKLNIDLDDLDYIVLSHNHRDHTGGLRYHEFKEKKKLIIHPQILDKLSKKESEKIIKDFEVIESNMPLEFAKNIFYLGEIPRKTSFETGMYENDKMLDDSAIAIKTKRGVFVISGCSHSGICNICEYAKKITKQKLFAVLGGFHLFEHDQKAVRGTIDYFKREKPQFLYPMHCVDFPTMVQLRKHFNFKKYSSGEVIEV